MPCLDPYVGTWRPHRPRGPIAALYKSPGPKYSLPTLTGTSKHDPTKYQAPMYSMGIRHRELSASHSPGPKYFIPSNISTMGRDGTPAFSIKSRAKELELFKVPGPGHYFPEKAENSLYPKSPSFSLYGRSKEGLKNLTPGPATYNLPPVIGPKVVSKTSAPAPALSGRSKNGSFHEDLKKTPGPAAYNVVDPSIYGKKPPQFSMSGRNFTPEEGTKKPGPGAHYPEHVRNFSFF
uniref:Outer dense fiber protein 3-B-like n=1 Tax=Gouania willdenowi TaxID=441366 RepID=A0A8C5D5Y1_GOUWI